MWLHFYRLLASSIGMGPPQGVDPEVWRAQVKPGPTTPLPLLPGKHNITPTSRFGCPEMLAYNVSGFWQWGETPGVSGPLNMLDRYFLSS